MHSAPDQDSQITSYQKTLVQTSFQMVVPITQDAAAMFYQRLFLLDPALTRLFPGDMKEQGRRLMQMIALAVRGLDRLDTLVAVVEELGRRHADYGVRPEHYESVGAALLWTLEQVLGAGFTTEVREAWTVVYGVLSASMRKGAALTAA